MPCSTWEEVAGKRCEICGGYATHYYGNRLTCCDCHGGYLCSQEEAKREHEHVILEQDDEECKKKREAELNSLDKMDISGKNLK